MTETKWLACSEPSLMLKQLQGRVSERKLRLFACACWRRVWTLLSPADHRAIEAAERCVDGLLSFTEMLALAERAATWGARHAVARWVDADGAAAEARSRVGSAACQVAETELEEVGLWKQAVYHESRKQCALLRCIAGNPFRPPNLPEAWRGWNDGALVKMAQAICDDRRWTDLPILADALEDAGCTDVLLLDHCRTPTEHARGCHVLDALLGWN